MNARRDDFKHSYYMRAIRTSIGAALRDHYAPIEPLPDRLEKLLEELNETEKGVTSGATSEDTLQQSASNAKPAPRIR